VTPRLVEHLRAVAGPCRHQVIRGRLTGETRQAWRFAVQSGGSPQEVVLPKRNWEYTVVRENGQLIEQRGGPGVRK
jgi:hypothetical protein